MNVDREFNVGVLLERLVPLAPSGFAVALHIRYSSPRYLFQNYPQGWRDRYSASGLVMDDPIVAWCFSGQGTTRWSDIARQTDPRGRRVLNRARDFGMAFGVAVAHLRDGTRSIAGLARPDREYSDTEIVEIAQIVANLHAASGGETDLTEDDHDTLRRLSIHLTRET